MKSLFKNSFTLIGLLLIAGLGYYLFVLNDGTDVVEKSAEIERAQIATNEFVALLEELKSIELSDELFTDQRFRSFVDFTEPVETQPVGRPNPFAPVE